MVGTFAGALEARQIPAGGGRLTAEVRGEIELEDNVLVIRRIHVVYHLKTAPGQGETIDRAHRVHQQGCPVYRSLHKAIQITSEVAITEESGTGGG